MINTNKDFKVFLKVYGGQGGRIHWLRKKTFVIQIFVLLKLTV